MYSDLFEQLGGGAMGRGGGNQAGAPSAPAEKKPIVSLKAGKVNLSPNADRGTYSCTADPGRGEIRLACVNNVLEWQWYDRRQKKVVDRRVVPTTAPSIASSPAASAAASASNVMSDDDATADGAAGSSARWRLEKVGDLPRTHKDDRVYVLTHRTSRHDSYDMYWMQDADEGKEEEVVAEFNRYLADPVETIAQHGTGGSSGGGAASGAAASSRSVTSPSSQVDALSSILENLGMPQSSSDASPTSTSGGTNALTLADLQGAMAGIHQQQSTSSSSSRAVMSLADVVTPDAVAALLQDEAACARLVELLPEDQRSREMLEENLRSPQVQQTLRALTSALLPDDAGHIDGFLSVVANFQLGSGGSPSQGTVLAASTNPVQAFLDAILESTEKDKEDEETKEE